MSGARFARSGRFRLLAGFFLIILLVGILALYHSSSIQCETTIENLRRQAESQRYQMERVKEQETQIHMESQRSLEENLKKQREQHEKELLDARLKLEQLQQAHNLLKNDHNDLMEECNKNKKQQLDDANSLEKKLQSLRSELKKSKTLQENEVTLWKEKYNAVVKEKSQLEGHSNQTESEKRMKLLESIVAEFSSNCVYKPKTVLTDLMQPQINNPLNPSETTHSAGGKSGHLKLPAFDKPQNEKTFKAQESVSPGSYYIPIKVTNQTLKNNSLKDTNLTFKSNQLDGEGVDGGVGNNGEKHQMPPPLPYSAQNNRSLFLHSVENFQIIPKPLKKLSDEETQQETQLKQQPDNAAASPGKVSPLSAPRKLSSTQSAKAAHRVLEQANNASAVLTSSSSSTSLPPLPVPPNQRKQLPAMVAPIPEFDQLLKDEAAEKKEQQQQESPKKKATAERDAGDIDAAIENDDQGTNNNNNRYANVVNDMDAKKSAKAVAPAAAAGANNPNDDFGAREVKDNNEALVNEPNFNLPNDEDENNFFDAGDKNAAGDLANAGDDGKHKNDDNDDDDDLGGGADIAVKNHNLLEADNLNNEVAGDQGKEFPDGLRLEDANDEDEDEDEYANLAARQQGAQAIRN